jgi:hypothetical protein
LENILVPEGVADLDGFRQIIADPLARHSIRLAGISDTNIFGSMISQPRYHNLERVTPASLFFKFLLDLLVELLRYGMLSGGTFLGFSLH